MLILNMLLRITGFTQDELANYVNMSRASINCWLHDDSSMSETSKKKIAEKFSFPVMFFNYDLNQDIELYKIIYSTIYESWNKINKQIVSTSKIDNIINRIEKNFCPSEEFTNQEIVEALINNCNPFTGELFESNHILNDIRVRKALISINKKDNKKFGVNNITKDDLSKEDRMLFEKLRIWRTNKTEEEKHGKAYLVFSDKELINIIKANINYKEELLKIKGIGPNKYQKYADELFNIININKLEINQYE